MIGAAGGLGHYAVQILQAFGCKVLGVDVGESAWSSCARWAPTRAVSAGTPPASP